MQDSWRQGLEEYAKSLDLSLDELFALLDRALSPDPAAELPAA